jgi:hypothetical protein
MVQPIYPCRPSDNGPADEHLSMDRDGPTASSIARTEAYDPVTRCLVRVGEPVPAEGDG